MKKGYRGKLKLVRSGSRFDLILNSAIVVNLHPEPHRLIGPLHNIWPNPHQSVRPYKRGEAGGGGRGALSKVWCYPSYTNAVRKKKKKGNENPVPAPKVNTKEGKVMVLFTVRQ